MRRSHAAVGERAAISKKRLLAAQPLRSASLFEVLNQQQQRDAHQSERSAAVLHLRLADGASSFLMLGPGESHGSIPTGVFYTTPPRKRVGTAACSQGPLQTVTS